MKIMYVRVSSKQQNEIRQIKLAEILEAEKVYIDKESGKNITDRPELNKLLKFARSGDVVMVESIDRLARNTKDLLELKFKPDPVKGEDAGCKN